MNLDRTPPWMAPIAGVLVDAYVSGRMTAHEVVHVCDAIELAAAEVWT